MAGCLASFAKLAEDRWRLFPSLQMVLWRLPEVWERLSSLWSVESADLSVAESSFKQVLEWLTAWTSMYSSEMSEVIQYTYFILMSNYLIFTYMAQLTLGVYLGGRICHSI